MRLYLLPRSFKRGQSSIEITGKDYNYIVNALRLKKGSTMSARDREGFQYQLTVQSISKGSCVLQVKECTQVAETTDTLPKDRPTKPIVLYQCLPKGRKADDIIKRATEMGVFKIVLVNSRNCVANIDGKEQSRISRYDSVIAEAVQQSGSLVPTSVEGVIDIKDIPDHFEGICRTLGMQGLGLVLHQCRLKESQSSLFDCVYKYNGATAVVVGPEGGLTDDECEALMANGFKAVLLKTNILRCETASLYAISAIQTIVESTCV